MNVLDVKPYCYGNQECYNIPCLDPDRPKCKYKKECYLKTLDNLGELNK